MFYLPASLKAWHSSSFKDIFRQEVTGLDATLLPLQQGLKNSSYAISDKLSITVLSTNENSTSITIKAGLLYNGIIAGCSCSDDPTPTDETNEYCDVEFCINKNSAKTTVSLIS